MNNGLTLQLPIIGKVGKKDPERRCFTVKTRGGTEFEVLIKPTTWFDTAINLDRLARQRVPLDQKGNATKAGENPGPLEANVKEGDLIAVEGTYYEHGAHHRYEAMTIHALKSHKGYYLFEHTHWWKTQLECMANKWLDVLFGDKRSYELDDFSALYRTTLNIEGMPTDDQTQEMATLSRLIYGLSSAYLLGGDERYFRAAKAGVAYQREAFRSYSADGRFCFWIHARKRDRHGIYDVFPSTFGDDANTIPLYEQIYALAGLAQYYRITGDRETLLDIHHTLMTFEALFADRVSNGDEKKHNGFFSHIDPITFHWNSPELDRTGNRARKNWNSIGDHLPAYLINLVLALDPLPAIEDGPDREEHAAFLERLLKRSVETLEVTAGLILDKFPEQGNIFVNERFERTWEPVKDWGWQQDRAVVGHNLKIAWNLTRVANYYRAKGQHGRANELFDLCKRIGNNMANVGIDQIRSGVFDAVERHPVDANIPVQFAWMNTKDFWQQEQGILAYLIMFGYIQDPTNSGTAAFLDLARELSAVWNLYFLDHERSGFFFRISDNGIPIIHSTYGDKGGHSGDGYHAFELDYLAHIYQLAYLPRQQQQHTTFCLHFQPSPDSGLRSINVLPDFLGPDAVKIAGVEIDGIPKEVENPLEFCVKLRPEDLGRHVMVYICQSDSAHKRLSQHAIEDEHLR